MNEQIKNTLDQYQIPELVIHGTPESIFDAHWNFEKDLTFEELLASECGGADDEPTGTLKELFEATRDNGFWAFTSLKENTVHLWFDGEVKYTSNKQPKIQSENEDISGRMPLINPEDPSFEKIKFAAVCASDGTFSTEVPDDYKPFADEFREWKTKHKTANSADIDAYKKTLREKYSKEYLEGEYKTDIRKRKMPKTDSTEQAILKFFEQYEDILQVRERYPLLGNNAKIPFNSTIKSTVYVRKVYTDSSKTNYTLRVAVKGAAERVIELCDKYLMKGKEQKMTPEFKKRLAKIGRAHV